MIRWLPWNRTHDILLFDRGSEGIMHTATEDRLKNRFRLLIPVAVLCICDVSLTLAGQPAEYWNKSYSITDEANVLAANALRHGPVAFAGFAAVWFVMIAQMTYFLRDSSAMSLAYAFVLGHTVGCAFWLARYDPFGWILSIGFITISAEFTGRCIRKPLQNQKKSFQCDTA
jgi:hypothetical protein